MTYETLLFEQVDGIATVTLNRPERMNSISAEMKRELTDVFTRVVPNDAAIRVVILTGAGEKAFCAGADIKERSAQNPTAAEFIATQRQTHKLFTDIAECDRPVIAAVNGVALGGGFEMALCADIRIVSDTARLGLTEVNLGVIPAGGGTQRLARLVGAATAKRLLFTGIQLAASEASRLGLTEPPVAPSALVDTARALARTIAAKPPLAVRFAKQVVDRGEQTDLASGLEFELYAAGILFASEDRKEGMAAFLEKRAPRFSGR